MHLLNGVKRIIIDWKITWDNHKLLLAVFKLMLLIISNISLKTASNNVITRENSSINE